VKTKTNAKALPPIFFKLLLCLVATALCAVPRIAWATPQTFFVKNTNDTGPDSLRQAILDANANSATTDTIAFTIPASGVQTISLNSTLPDITDAVIIDGTSQPGYAGQPLIEINGASAGGGNGLNIKGGGSKISALIINRFAGNGIIISTQGGNTITGCYIGTDATGTGGTQGNTGLGIQILGAPNNIIGGATAAERNVISANGAGGIEIINAGATGNIIHGNFIGVDVNGTAGLGNGNKNGITVDGASTNFIGGVGTGEGNTIAFNRIGVSVINGSTGVDILANSIHDNFDSISPSVTLGIDLGNNGVTPNDAGDGDPGENDFQNFPQLGSAVSDGGKTAIQGTLNSTADTTFRVEFFSSPNCDPSGNGEGQTFLGSTLVTTDAAGNANIRITLTSPTAAGQAVTATATDPANNTSEFSACVPVTLSNATLGNYSNTSVSLGGDTTNTPSAAPTNTARITVSTSPDFKGKLEADPVTGIVRITDAHPAATYHVSVTAFDAAFGPTTKTFFLTVTTPATCNPISFKAAANFDAGATARRAVVGDFNRDGIQDLAVANTGSNNVSILLGNGAGGFGIPPANFTVGGFPESVAIGDFNGDGKQDLAVSCRTANAVSILLGDGTGGFAAAVDFPAGNTPFFVAVGEFNGDGQQDLVVANGNAVNGSILFGDGTGGFSAPATLSIGTLPVSVAVGDFNGDGKQDLVLTNGSSDDITVVLGDGAGGFSEPGLRINVGNSPQSVAIGDFNNDGKQDLAVANGGGPHDISVLLGDGSGGFSAAINYPVDVSPSSVAVGDLDGDGNQDLIAANATSNDVSVLLGNGMGAFGAATNFIVGANPGSVAVGDFNGDGALDLVTANRNANNVSVLLRQCQPTLVIGNSTQLEGNSGVTDFPFVLTLSSTSASDATVHFVTQDGTAAAGSDYVGIPDTILTIPAGSATSTIHVQVNGDTTPEPDETFRVVLSNPSGATLAGAPAVGTGTITNDDAPTPTPTPTPSSTPTPTVTPTSTPTPSPAPSATPTSTPTPNPTATPTPATPTPTPSGGFARLSTRALVQTGDDVLIGGFTITGSVPKHVLVRALGPSLTVARQLADPVLELHGPGAFITVTNDNWRDTQETEIQATGLAPTNDSESAIDATLPPGAYTAVVRGKNNTTGVALVEVYDLNQAVNSQLASISSRARADIPENVIVGEFTIPGPQSQQVVIRGLGPSLAAGGEPNPLADPTLELRDGNGALLVSNNDWQDDPVQAVKITAAGLAPSNNKESAIAATLPPGSYTAVLAGLNCGTGVALVEVYNRGLAGNATDIPASSPLPTCAPTPTPTPPQSVNISTRGRVEVGDNVLIGGFIITGQSPRKILIRALGPSLAASGVPDPLADPTLQLRASDGSLIRTNDNWKDDQRGAIEATGIPPKNDLESAIVAILSPGSYTAILSGKDQTTGVALLEIYDLDKEVDSKLANISTRGLVLTGNNVLIGGFIFGGNTANTSVVVRAIGPSLSKAGLSNTLTDPTLELHDANGNVLASNDDWKDDEAQAHLIKIIGLAPTDDRESALAITLPPGGYTAVVFGKNGGTGVGLVEIYNLN
jgi:hypothetical protein